MKCIKFEYEKKYIKDFIKLPKILYTKKDNMEDSDTIKTLLLDKHPLSKYFKLHKFLIYDDYKVVGRFIITEYKKDSTAYLGFFECINDKKCAKYLFDNVYEYAKEHKFRKIIGPVDASFWLKYRLKINKFERPYTGEPYNKDYYYKLFLDNKYKVVEHYISNLYNTVDYSYHNDKFEERLKKFTENGYDIVKPKMEDFDKCISETYDMIVDLYSDFPIFKTLSKEDFKEVFSSFKKIINMDMVRMAYYKDKAVGFYISVPNYNNIVYNLNLFNIFKILYRRKYPKSYVMLYMGVDRNHTGLGKALAASIIEELKNNRLPSIGALARDGKINQKYVSEKIKDQYEYVLLERKVL